MPSSACATCSRRRIECDQARPQCGQCTNAGRHCPGYQEEWADRWIADNEVQLAPEGDHQGRAIAFVEPPTATRRSVDEHASALPPINSPPVPNRDELVLGYYFTTFVNPFPRVPRLRSYFMIMPFTYLQYKQDSALHAAILSLAHRRYCTAPGAQYSICVQHARKYYDVALTRLGSAINDPHEVSTNETLLTAILLQIIEAETSTVNIESSHAMHVAGIYSLIRSRGPQGFNNPESRKTLASARGIKVMNDSRSLILSQERDAFSRFPLRRNFDVPFMPDATSTAIPDGETKEVIVCPVTHVSPLWQDAETHLNQSPNDQTIAEVKALVDRCITTDGELLQAMQESLKPPQVYEENPKGIPESTDSPAWSRADHFDDIIHSRSWNEYRAARLFLHDIRFRCLRWILENQRATDDEAGLELCRGALAESEQISQVLINDICASIPYLWGYTSEGGVEPHPLGFYFIFPVLSLCQANERIDAFQREWILSQLVRVLERVGIHQTKAGIAVRNKLHMMRGVPLFASMSPSSATPPSSGTSPSAGI